MCHQVNVTRRIGSFSSRLMTSPRSLTELFMIRSATVQNVFLQCSDVHNSLLTKSKSFSFLFSLSMYAVL